MYVSTPPKFGQAIAPHSRPPQDFRRAAPQTRSLAEGAHLFHEGDAARSLYIVNTGILRLIRYQVNGQRRVLGFCYPGDAAGFPLDGRHAADCEAVVPAHVTILKTSGLRDGGIHPRLQQKLLEAALQEISCMQDHFMTLGRKSATQKLASFLLLCADRIGRPLGGCTHFDLPMPRRDIADYLGLTPETVSRTFTQLRNMKALMLDHIYTVVLLDRTLLENLAEDAD